MRGTLALAVLLFTLCCSTDTTHPKGAVVAGRARFTVIAPECIRLEYSEDGRFVNQGSMFAANRGAGFHDYVLSRDGKRLAIDTGVIELTYTADGTPFGPHNLQALIRTADSVVSWVPGQENDRNLGGTLPAIEGTTGPVDLGQGLLSRDGWYLLDDSQQPLLTNGWVEARPADAGIDWYLFGYGGDYKAALRALTAIGGAVPLPRKQALGAWYSRFWPHNSLDYRRIVEEYREHDFPLDIVAMDMDWHTGEWTGWSWNRYLLPDAEHLLQWFHEQRLAVTLNVHPAGGVAPGEEMYESFMKGMGEDPATGVTLPFDAADQKYLETLFEHTHLPLEKAGVDFWWLDWQQERYTRSLPALTNQAWLNHYYYRHTGRDGRRGMSLSRWAGWGDHRHVMHFSGDAEAAWRVLEFEVPFTTTAGNVGCFFWAHDIGGHKGPRDDEMYTRWVQFGAMSAALRPHSTRVEELDRRPWTYGKDAEQAMRRAFHLRSELFPYIYTSAWRGHRDSLPLLRPMYIEHPEDEQAYSNAQQYYLGDALLVAPIVTPGKGPRKIATQVVWFPGGTWFNWFTGERYKGEMETVVAADIAEFPLFVRGGVPIPMQPYTPRMATSPAERIVIRAYPGDEGRSELYEDDGLTTEYTRGRFATTGFHYTRRAGMVTVTVKPTRGDYAGLVDTRAYVVELAGTRRARAARVDGQAVHVEYDEAQAINRISVSPRSVTRGVTIEAEVEDADFEALSALAASRRLSGAIGERRLEDLNDPELLGVAMAIKGVTLQRKNEGVYLYRGKDLLLVNDRLGLMSEGFTLTVEDRAGAHRRTVLKHEKDQRLPLRLELPEFPAAGASVVGVPWIRTARLDFTLQGRPVSLTRELQRRASRLRHWSIVGPFPFTGKSDISVQGHGPERDGTDFAASYRLEDGQSIAWQSVTGGEDGTVDLRALLDYSFRLAYARSYLESDRQQAATFRIRSDDAVEVWLNGEKIHSHNVFRSIDMGPDVVEATLRKGTNTLLIKVANGISKWAFRVGVETQWAVTESD